MEEKLVPLRNIHMDLTRVSQGLPPENSYEDTLRMLNLHSDEPDGKTLYERLYASGTILGSITNFNPTRDSLHLLYGMIDKVTTTGLNEYEDTMLVRVANIATRQFQREGDMCPTTSQITTDIFKVRPDLVPPEVAKQAIKSNMVSLMELAVKLSKKKKNAKREAQIKAINTEIFSLTKILIDNHMISTEDSSS
jgi:hypothetical protein